MMLKKYLLPLLLTISTSLFAATPTATTTAPATISTAPTAPAVSLTANTSVPVAPVSTPVPAAPAAAVATASDADDDAGIAAPPVASAIPPAPDLNDTADVLMDANSGAVLAQKNMNMRVPPASLTKLMSLYLVFEALKKGTIHLNDPVLISKEAWQTGGSRMFVQVGTQVPVQELIQGVIVASGNDAMMALAQYVGGNTQTFVQMMNQTAQSLGMKDTHYMDPTGLPDPGHYATAYDLALLVKAIITNFPEYYHFFSQKWITYDGIKQPNRNRLLWHDNWVDGLKTGHTEEAGFCLIASGLQNGTRLIAVVMGAPTDEGRTGDAEALLNYGYRFFETKSLYTADQVITTPRVWMAKEGHVKLGVANALFVTVPKNQFGQIHIDVQVQKPLEAPIVQGQSYGTVVITLNQQTLSTTPLIALENDPVGGFFARLIDRIHMWFSKE